MAQLRIRQLTPIADNSKPKLRVRSLTTPKPAVDPNDAIRQQQAAKFPTAAERGDLNIEGKATTPGAGWQVYDAVFDTTGNDPNVQPMGHPVMEQALGSVTTGNPLQLWQGVKNIPQMVKQSPGAQIVKAGAGAADDLLTRAKTQFAKLRPPSEARAGAKFQTVLGAAKDVPLDLRQADEAVARAQELRTRGSTLPKVINDYTKSRKGLTGTVEFSEPMTYAAGRDFASNAGALSARETTAMNAKMQRQISVFAKAMRDANREAAASVGMGDLYDEAMREYRLAKTIQEKVQILKKWGKRAALGATGYAMLRELTGE